MPLSDQALILRTLQQDDRRAFEQLVLRYQSKVRTWARRLCRGDPQSAEDLAQETFIKAYSALRSFRGEASFTTWLYRITFNLAANRWRREHQQWCSLEDHEDFEAPNCSLNEAAVQRDMDSALAQLSLPQQWAIRLCLEDGLSHEEAASIMGIPLGTLKAHIARGKRKLQHLLAAWKEATA